jgi:hypothetical protein
MMVAAKTRAEQPMEGLNVGSAADQSAKQAGRYNLELVSKECPCVSHRENPVACEVLIKVDSPCRQEAVQVMLSQCANVQCSKPFLRLREGKLFLVEKDRMAKPGASPGPPFVRARQQPRQVEHYWLCDECAQQWTLLYEPDRGVALAPLRRPSVSVTPATSAVAATAGRSGVA